MYLELFRIIRIKKTQTLRAQSVYVYSDLRFMPLYGSGQLRNIEYSVWANKLLGQLRNSGWFLKEFFLKKNGLRNSGWAEISVFLMAETHCAYEAYEKSCLCHITKALSAKM